MLTLDYYKDKLEVLSATKGIYEKDLSSSKSQVKSLAKKMLVAEKAQVFLQQVAQNTQSQLKYQICEIVQIALDSCWPGEKEFSLEFEIKNNRTEASIRFIEEGQLLNPSEEDGGGVVDVASFALRLAVWSLGKTSPIILIDEPFKMLSVDLSKEISSIMKELSSKLGLQFIMITSHGLDMDEISDKVFEVKKKKKISFVEEEGGM